MNEDRPDALPVTESRMERHGPSIRVADQVKPAVDAGEDALDQRHFAVDAEAPSERKAVLALGKRVSP